MRDVPGNKQKYISNTRAFANVEDAEFKSGIPNKISSQWQVTQQIRVSLHVREIFHVYRVGYPRGEMLDAGAGASSIVDYIYLRCGYARSKFAVL